MALWAILSRLRPLMRPPARIYPGPFCRRFESPTTAIQPVRSWVRSPMNEEASAGFLPLHARTIDLQREPLPTPSLEKHQVDGV